MRNLKCALNILIRSLRIDLSGDRGVHATAGSTAGGGRRGLCVMFAMSPVPSSVLQGVPWASGNPLNAQWKVEPLFVFFITKVETNQ